MKTHKKSSTREYSIWKDMRRKCYNSNRKGYENYGGRGIIVCDEWKDSFENFLNDMGECPIGYSLERINNNSNYSKENCKWATKKEQVRNRRNTLIVTYNGETKPLAEFCNDLNLNYDTIRARIKVHKYTIEEAFSTILSYELRKRDYGQKILKINLNKII